MQKLQKDKQRSTKHTYTTKDRVTRTPLKTGGELRSPPMTMTYHRACNYINTTGVTSGARTAYPSGEHEFTSRFRGVRVTRSLVLCVCFVDRCSGMQP
jgi:hypothetical protein